MKTQLAVMIALTVSLGELTTSAAVLPAGAAFGGSLSLEGAGTTDLLKVGYPASVVASSASLFPSPSGGDVPQQLVDVDASSSLFYHFRLQYDKDTKDLVFRIWTADSTQAAAANIAGHVDGSPSNQGTVSETDVYQGLVAANLSGAAQNWGNLTSLAFGFYAPSQYQISLTDLTLTGASWVSGGPTKSLSFVGGGGPNAFSDILNGYNLPATGLSDGFTLDGVFGATRLSGSPSTGDKLGFEVYAVVPEPATVAFGLALVGGLGLMEVRRRKKA